MKTPFYLLLSLLTSFSFAQTPAPGLSQNFENGSRNQQTSAFCWVFPGTNFTANSAITGQFSGQTGPLSSPTTNGVQTPWALFTAPAQLTFKFRFSGNTWQRNMRVFLQEYKQGMSSSQMPSTVLLSEDYAAGTAPTTTQTRTVSINARRLPALHGFLRNGRLLPGAYRRYRYERRRSLLRRSG